MIAADSPANLLSGMGFDWFDLVFLCILGFGLFRGRSNGMTKELIPMLQWVAIFLVCGFVHPLLAPIIITQLKLSKMWGYVSAYLALLFVVMIPFSIIKHRYSKDLALSDYFKGSEYYLGMIAGLVKWVCIILVAFALLNAPVYTAQEIAAHEEYMHQTYGGGQQGYGGDYFPTMQSIQALVLKDSALGTFVLRQSFLKSMLINATPPPPPPKPVPVIQFGNQTVQ